VKKIYFLLIAVLLHFMVSAEEILKGIVTGSIFLVDSKGYIYVNSGEHSIAKYSPTGTLLLKIGKKGEGPSDIKRLGWFAINPRDNNIYVTEFFGGNKWISKFSKDGKYLGDWKCEIDWKKWQALSYIKFDNNGNIYLKTIKSVTRRCKDFSIGTSENAVIKFSPQGKKLKEIYKFNSDIYAEKGGKGNITIPFNNSLYWTIYNGNIIVRESGDKFISIFDLEGNFKKKISLPFKREKVIREDIDKWEKRIKSSRWGKRGISEGWLDLEYWKKRLPFPKYKPVSAYQLYIDSHGNLYSMKYPGSTTTHAICAKIDLSNGDVSIVNFRPGEWLLGTWKNYFFIQKVDDDDDYVVVKIDEKEFFKRY
jgi:hypothetical protein